jgi:hypothetical protein
VGGAAGLGARLSTAAWIVGYTGEHGSPAQQAMDLLASWTSTPERAPAVTTDHDT